MNGTAQVSYRKLLFFRSCLESSPANLEPKQFKNPPLVIIVTSDDSPGSRALAKRAGADAFVTKSGDLHAQLKAIFRQLFRAHYELCPVQ